MAREIFNDLLLNYTALLKRIDSHTGRVARTYKDRMACQKGCDGCCRFLTLFPVEALALSLAFEALPPGERARVIERINAQENGSDGEQCPLLIDRACMLYEARPVICRTHGFPLYIEKDGESLVDFCPKNFKGTTSFPKEALLNLEQLNTLLTAVNKHFLSMIDGDFPERIPVSQALDLCRLLDPDQG